MRSTCYVRWYLLVETEMYCLHLDLYDVGTILSSRLSTTLQVLHETEYFHAFHQFACLVTVSRMGYAMTEEAFRQQTKQFQKRGWIHAPADARHEPAI